MNFQIKHCRSKSFDFLNYLNEPTSNDGKFSESVTQAVSSPQNTSNCQYSPRTKKTPVDEVQSFERRQESPRSKSHEFLKRIFASSEKKNVACKADNEFITKYYSRESRSEEDCSRSLDEEELPRLKYRTYIKRSLQRDFEDIKRSEGNITFAETFHGGDDFPIHNHRNYEFIDKMSLERHDDFFLDNEVSEPSCGRRQSSSCATLERHNRKKVSRKKSFKQLLSSVVKWKKVGSKRSAKRFLSYDDLLEGEPVSKSSDADNLSRTISLQTVVLQGRNEDSTNEVQMRAVHSGYGSSKDEMQKWVVEETKRLFLTDETNFAPSEKRDEALVKPSAIKDIAKRYSQNLEVQQIEKRGKGVTRCKSARVEELYPRNKLLQNAPTGPPKQYITVCATRM